MFTAQGVELKNVMSVEIPPNFLTTTMQYVARVDEQKRSLMIPGIVLSEAAITAYKAWQLISPKCSCEEHDFANFEALCDRQRAWHVYTRLRDFDELRPCEEFYFNVHIRKVI
jgi:hypothetical protein